MTGFEGVLSQQVKGLLDALREKREDRCRQLTGDAETQRDALLRTSQTRLRERVRQAVREERNRREDAVNEARQRIEGARRRQVLSRDKKRMQAAWPLLLSELERRWSDAECRQAWCEMLLSEAARTLPALPWIVDHPDSWSESEVQWLSQRFAERRLPAPTFRATEKIGAGLVIRQGGVRLDGTIDGLLARRAKVQARLLAACHRAQS